MILCTIASLSLKLNLPLIQLVSYLVYPLQILFLIPFIRIGEKVLNVEPFPISIEALYNMIKTDIVQTIITFWDATMHGIFAWSLFAPFVIAAIYFISLPILKRMPIPREEVSV